MNTLSDSLVEITAAALPSQAADGSMPAGTNGAYGDTDSPIRNTSHWLVSFCNAHRLTGDERFRAAAGRALDYVLGQAASAKGGLTMRTAANKDKTNGILGPAHVLEGLHAARTVLGSEEALAFAVDYISRHTFNTEYRCWNSLTPEGQVATPDTTFNHQSYYAYAVSLFTADSVAARDSLAAFKSGLPKSFQIAGCGRISHYVGHLPGSPLHKIKNRIHLMRSRAKLEAKERDYHLYNLYAFSLLKKQGHDISQLEPKRFAVVKDYTESPAFQEFIRGTENSPENPRSGTETIVCDYLTFSSGFLGRQLSASDFERASAFLSRTCFPGNDWEKKSPDVQTQRARAYRYWQLID